LLEATSIIDEMIDQTRLANSPGVSSPIERTSNALWPTCVCRSRHALIVGSEQSIYRGVQLVWPIRRSADISVWKETAAGCVLGVQRPQN